MNKKTDGKESPTRRDAVAEVLLRHIPSVEAHGAILEAERLLRKMSVAKALSQVDANDRRPKRDAKKLRDSAKAILRARKHLSEVGFAGCAQISETREDKRRAASSIPRGLSSSTIAQRSELVDHFDDLAELMCDVARALDSAEVKSDQTYNDHAPEKLVALAVCGACVEIYEKHIGVRPARRIHTGTSISYGPFFDLVSEVFAASGVDGKPEYFLQRVLG